jgi:hypothetical protein
VPLRARSDRHSHDISRSSGKQANVIAASVDSRTLDSAALIMVAVFSIFVTMPLIDLKILGVGTAAAVLIDGRLSRACCSRPRSPC